MIQKIKRGTIVVGYPGVGKSSIKHKTLYIWKALILFMLIIWLGNMAKKTQKGDLIEFEKIIFFRFIVTKL